MAEEQISDVNISDVIEVIETDEMYAGRPGRCADSDNTRPRPRVEITEQPASKALRFRYECEGRSAGSIPGVNSTHENKTYPAIRIVDYQGKAVVVVSCVTKEHPYRPHPHNLVGKEGCNRGVCTMKMDAGKMTFSNLGIQCVKKKDIEEALKLREELRIDPFRTGFSHKNQPSNIDLNCVRLCFQVFLEGPKKDSFTIQLKPVVSDPIYDKKAMSDLTICKLSHCSDSVTGGQEIILLCEKVAKEDISVRFYEERNNELYWEAQGDFQPVNVHKQVAITFRAPQYKNIDIEHPVNVMLQLRRPSDGAVSESVPFQYMPLDSDPAQLKRKRQKYDGESGPQNMFRTSQDDSRCSYAMSPDMGYHMLQVKREPSEYSPLNYNYGGSVSPMYASKSPELRSSQNTPSPVPPMNYPNMNFKFNSGGGILEVKSPGVDQLCKQDVSYPEAGTSKQTAGASLMPYPSNYVGNNMGEGGLCVQGTLVQPGMNLGVIGSTNFGTVYPHSLLQKNESDTNRSQIPVETGNTYINMDSQQYSSELHLSHLDTDELDKLAEKTDANLSANLSASLTLDDNPLKPSVACDQSTMADGFTIAPDEIQELMELSAMDQTYQK